MMIQLNKKYPKLEVGTTNCVSILDDKGRWSRNNLLTVLAMYTQNKIQDLNVYY